MLPAEIPILATKFFPPFLGDRAAARNRLLEKLDSGLHAARLVLVSAPPGFGKSTLVAEWMRAHEGESPALRFAWLTLDDEDNAPLRFWRYVLASLRNIDPCLGEKILPVLQSSPPPPIRAIVASLLNEVVTLSGRVIMVLDDYHQIRAAEVHDSVNYLLDHLPPNLTVVVLTRSDPPLQLARRRGKGELLELRALDLRFNLLETTFYLNQLMKLNLEAADVAALQNRTEGWIVGLQMAAVAMRSSGSADQLGDPHAFITAFTGDDRYIADYLIEEVLQRQPESIQTFLLQTSVLEQFNAPLCDAVTGRQDSRQLLADLERANLFIIPLDHRRESFRFHHLFASLLQQNLISRFGMEQVQVIRQRASTWYEQAGMVSSAIHYALASQDYAAAIRLLERKAGKMFAAGELVPLIQWAEKIPADLLRDHPLLGIIFAWAANVTGQQNICLKYLHLLEELLGVSFTGFLQGVALPALTPLERSILLEASTIRLSLQINQMEFVGAEDQALRLLEHLAATPVDQPFVFNPPEHLAAPVTFILALALKLQGNLAAAVERYQQAIRLAEKSNNYHIVAIAFGHLGEIQVIQGRLNAAEQTFRTAIQYYREHPNVATPFFGLAEVGLGTIAFERGQDELAAQHMRRAIEMSTTWRAWEILTPAYQVLARLDLESGRIASAHARMDQLVELVEDQTTPLLPGIQGYHAYLDMLGGVPGAAEKCLASNSIPPGEGEIPAFFESIALIQAHSLLIAGRLEEAYILCQRVIAGAERNGRMGRVIEALCVQAKVLNDQGKYETAKACLKRARELGIGEGYRRAFRIADGLDVRQPSPVLLLSPREVEILTLVASGAGNAEIASQLYLSLNTVKKHITNIYTKLGVSTRLQAVEAGRRLKLLP
ncbi:MAG TPA: tetratricopeptide repeat protein [Anaerolineaceae bacterium]